MNTEKIAKYKKSLENANIPANVKTKIEAEIKRLEDLDAKQKEASEKKEETPAPAKKVRAKRTPKPTPSKTSKPKATTRKKPARTVMSIAKEIRKEGESWKDAQARAKKVIKDDSAKVTKKVESELDKLNRLVKRRKELRGMSGKTDLQRDAKRKALPAGKRISKEGNVYYENRANRMDRGTFGKYHLADGGYLTDPNFGQFQNMMFDNGGKIDNKQLNLGYSFSKEKDDNNRVRIYKEHSVYFVEGFKDNKHFSESFEKFSDAKKHYESIVEKYDNGGGVKQQLKKGDDVLIIGRRWFDRINGNTYHTAEVVVNDKVIGKSRMTYGYDEQYVETGKEILLQHFDLPKGMKENAPLWQLREHGIEFRKRAIDGLKRDLEVGGSVGRYEVVKVIGFDKNGDTLPKNELKVIADFDKRKDALDFAYDYSMKRDITQRDLFIRDSKLGKEVKFELGGNVGGYDLAGHLGGNWNVGQNDGDLSGVSGTQYSGLVGETGAMSSGEMFARGGSVRNERRHVNKAQDYEVRYARKRPSRTGYKGKRSLVNGGGISDTPKIYVADLSAYNNGKLVGEWLDLSDYNDADELNDAIQNLLDKWGVEEYAIHDYENLPSSMYSEYMGARDFEQLYEMMDLAKENDLPLAVVQEIVSEYDTDAIENFYGRYDSAVDFAEQLVDDTGIQSFTDFERYLIVSETDKRLLAQEMADNYVDDIRDEDDGERLIEEAELDLEEYQEGDEDTREEMLDKAREIVYDRIYEEWETGLDDPYYFLVEEQGLYDAESFANANFVQIDYDALADALEYDYTFVQHDGEVYVFNIH